MYYILNFLFKKQQKIHFIKKLFNLLIQLIKIQLL